MAKTNDHEMVSIYPFTEAERDILFTHCGECCLMWGTKDHWPVGVTTSYVWHEGKIWITFTAHRHRYAAIKRDNRVSVNVSTASYGPNTPAGAPTGAITVKGYGEFHEDDETRAWFYPALSKKIRSDDPAGEAFFNQLLDSPTRVMLAVTPEKYIMYNQGLAARHMAGTVEKEELGAPLESDAVRMNQERAKRGLPAREFH